MYKEEFISLFAEMLVDRRRLSKTVEEISIEFAGRRHVITLKFNGIYIVVCKIKRLRNSTHPNGAWPVLLLISQLVGKWDASGEYILYFTREAGTKSGKQCCGYYPIQIHNKTHDNNGSGWSTVYGVKSISIATDLGMWFNRMYRKLFDKDE